MNRFNLVFTFGVAAVLTVLSPSPVHSAEEKEKLPPLPSGPLLLTSVTPEQLKADFWINRLSDPDKVIKTTAQLKTLNEDIRFMIPERKDIFDLDLNWSGKSIRSQIELEYKTLRGRVLYDVQDVRVPRRLFEGKIKPVLNLEKIPARIRMKWGAAVRPTSIRALPSNVKMLEKKGDIEFDQLQFSLIKLWTPVGIYHTSSDGKWYYIQAPYVRGWVKAPDIAVFSGREELKKLTRSQKFIVVTGESIPVFNDTLLQEAVQRPTMGTVLPLAGKTEKIYDIWMPVRKTDGSAGIRRSYVSRKNDVTEGYPAFTQRNIIRQAFKLLGARYGWGGMYNGRDCSGFVHDVFLSLGVDMPRDSKQQAFVGTQLGHFEPFEQEAEKIAALRAGAAGITLLKMPLHMMLYLGEVDGKFYIIHSTWAERISKTSDAKNRINQVVISDLSLNGRSYLGDLLSRTVSINEVN